MQTSECQVEAYFFGSPQWIGEKILFIKREGRLAEYAAYLTDVEMFGHVWRGITGKLRGEPVSVIATGIGPSLIGDAVYALDRPGAACLYSGTCGSLYEALDIGDTFVADQAVCGAGYYSQTFRIVRANGDLWPCFVRVAEPDFRLGNIISDSLETVALNTLYIAARRKPHCDSLGCCQCHVNYTFEQGLQSALTPSTSPEVRRDPMY